MDVSSTDTIAKIVGTRLMCKVCHRRHSTIMHIPDRATEFSESHNFTKQIEGNKPPTVVHSCQNYTATEGTMAIFPVKVRKKGCNSSMVTYAFIDSGSNVSFCAENLTHQLGVKGKTSKAVHQYNGCSTCDAQI